MTDRIYKNGVNMGNLGFWILLVLVAMICSNLLIAVEDGFQVGGVVIAGALGAFVFLAVPWRMEFLWRPPRVEIVDTGVILHQRYWREPLNIAWSDIVRLNIHPLDPRVTGLKGGRDGFLTIRGCGHYYRLEWEAGNAMREAYRGQMGEYPHSTWDLELLREMAGASR